MDRRFDFLAVGKDTTMDSTKTLDGCSNGELGDEQLQTVSGGADGQSLAALARELGGIFKPSF